MLSLQPALTLLLSSLPPSPYEQSKLDQVVKDVLEKHKDKSVENRKAMWEYLLKEQIFKLAVGEPTYCLKTDWDSAQRAKQ